MLHTLLHAGIQDFISGGGGGPGLMARKLSGPFFCFLVLNLFYSLQRASNGFITEKTILSNDPEGVQHFPGGSNFSTGVQMLISIGTHITCDFPGWGSGPPIPPLDPHLFWVFLTCSLYKNMYKNTVALVL